MVTKPTRSRHGETANINDLVLVNDDLFMTESEHCCPLGKVIVKYLYSACN